MHRPSLSRTAPLRRLAGALALLVVPAVVAGPAARPASADDAPPSPGAPACAAPPKRLSALEHEIRHLERHLQGLRRARADAAAGRSETFPADANAVRATEAAQRTLREIQRYESARARALVHLGEACAADDAAKAGEARAALLRLDEDFVTTLEQAEAKDAAARAKAETSESDRKGDPEKKARPDRRDGTPDDASPAKKTGGKRHKPDSKDDDDDPEDDAR